MPTVTITPYTVYLDGIPMTVDGSDLFDSAAPNAAVNAVQWNGSTGWIEYVNDPFDPDPSHFKPNRHIMDFAQFQKYVAAWHEAKIVADEERAKLEALIQQMEEEVRDAQ